MGQNWINLYDSTELYWGSDWSKCISLLSRAVELAEADIGKDDPNYAVLINDLGLCYVNTKQYQNATTYFQEAIEIKKRIHGKRHEEYALSAANLAGLYQQTGEFLSAENLYLEAIIFYQSRRSQYQNEYLQTLQDLGLLYEGMGFYHQATSYFERLLKLIKQQHEPDPTTHATTLRHASRLLMRAGDYQKSLTYAEQALDLFPSSEDVPEPEYIMALNDLGNLYLAMGEYSSAENSLLKTIRLWENAGNAYRLKYAESLNNLANLHQTLGNYDQAEGQYLTALEIYEQALGNKDPELATILNNLANYYENNQAYGKALDMYQRAIQIYLDFYGSQHPTYAQALNNLGSLQRQLGDFSGASESYQTAIEINKKMLGENHPSYASSLANLAMLYIYTGSLDEAKNLYEQALNIQREVLGENHPSLAALYNNLAIAYYIKHDLASAEPLFKAAIANQLYQIDNIFPSLSEKEKEDFYKTLKSDLERFNTFAIERMYQNPSILEDVFNNQLATKAILFRATTKMRDNILGSGDHELIAQFNQWIDLREILGYYYQLGNLELETRNIDLNALEEQANQLEKTISQKSELFAKETSESHYTWLDLKQLLGPKEAVVELVRFRKFDIREDLEETEIKSQGQAFNYGFSDEVYYIALIITAKSEIPEIILLENGKELETRFTAYYRNSVRFVLEDRNSYKFYWSKIDKRLNDIDKVYFSPDGVYNILNVSAMINPATGKYVFDEKIIYNLTSSRDLLEIDDNINTSREAVFFADPNYMAGGPSSESNPLYSSSGKGKPLLKSLPGTAQEVKEIDKITSQKQWHNNIFMGDEAMEHHLKAVDNPRVLHIASHGFFSRKDIDGVESKGNKTHNILQRSGIMLAGAERTLSLKKQGLARASQQEDGILTAYEAMNLRLDNTDLVVLSACETGLGELVNGEGVYGLKRAFLVAGAKSVILSLWQVDDQATKELIVHFYEEWMKNGDKVMALRAAQMLLREKYEDPYYWAGFIIVGT